MSSIREKAKSFIGRFIKKSKKEEAPAATEAAPAETAARKFI